MINENFPIEKKEKSEYPPLPENMYQVQLLDVNVEEKPNFDTKNKPDEEKVYEKVLKFQFTLLNGTDPKAEKKELQNLRCRNVFEGFVPTYLYIGKNGHNKLYQIIHALIGRELTQEEEATFNSQKVNELVGMQCRVGIKQKTKDGKVYSNIETYYAKEQDLPALTPEEVEKATIKKDDDRTDPEEIANPSEGTAQHPQAEPQIASQEEEISVSDIPY